MKAQGPCWWELPEQPRPKARRIEPQLLDNALEWMLCNHGIDHLVEAMPPLADCRTSAHHCRNMGNDYLARSKIPFWENARPLHL
jgi:hypothetical protein